jgi:hypothetical protein
MKLTLSFLAFLLIAMLADCVYALPVSNPSTNVKLRLQSPQPQSYSVRVIVQDAPTDYPVTADGRVNLTVLPFRDGCTVYFLGLKVKDATPERMRVIEVRRGERTIRRLSLEQITKLKQDDAGYRLVKVGD